MGPPAIPAIGGLAGPYSGVDGSARRIAVICPEAPRFWTFFFIFLIPVPAILIWGMFVLQFVDGRLDSVGITE